MPRPKSAAQKPAAPTWGAKSLPQESRSAQASTDTSEGPTLPIIGGGPETALAAGPRAQDRGDERPANKRRRTEEAAPGSSSTGQLATSANVQSSVSEEEQQRRQANAPLFEPWTLLPAPLREMLVMRLATAESQSSLQTQAPSSVGPASERLRDVVTPVVFTKNQNIKAGVNKLRDLLSDADRRVIAVSAQGDGTTKLVGIVEMVKRVLSEQVEQSRAGGGEGQVEAQVDPVYVYTVLTSRAQTHERKGRSKALALEQLGDAARNGEEDEGAFESLVDIRDRDRVTQRATREVPVLTVWCSRTRLERLRDVYGEETIEVGREERQGVN